HGVLRFFCGNEVKPPGGSRDYVSERRDDPRRGCRNKPLERPSNEHESEAESGEQAREMKPIDQALPGVKDDEEDQPRRVQEGKHAENRIDRALAPAVPWDPVVALAEEDAPSQAAPVGARAVHQVRKPQPLAQEIVTVELDQRVGVEDDVEEAA